MTQEKLIEETDSEGPHPATRRVVLVLAYVHLGFLFLSYSAVVGPSTLHSRVLQFAEPLLRSTHFAADGRPFYLAQGTADEQPHRLQIASFPERDEERNADGSTQWTTVQPGGLAGFAGSDRYRRWMRLVATLAESDQHSLAAALLMPLVDSPAMLKVADASGSEPALSSGPSIDAVRVIRLPTQLTTVADDAAPPVYLARVVRRDDEVRLISIDSPRLTTSPNSLDQVVEDGAPDESSP